MGDIKGKCLAHQKFIRIEFATAKSQYIKKMEEENSTSQDLAATGDVSPTPDLTTTTTTDNLKTKLDSLTTFQRTFLERSKPALDPSQQRRPGGAGVTGNYMPLFDRFATFHPLMQQYDGEANHMVRTAKLFFKACGEGPECDVECIFCGLAISGWLFASLGEIHDFHNKHSPDCWVTESCKYVDEVEEKEVHSD